MALATYVRHWGSNTYHGHVDKKQQVHDTLLHYDTKYKVLICRIHKYAICDPVYHLKREHCVTGKESDALIRDWLSLDLCAAKASRIPPDEQEERSWLATPVAGYSCTGCRFLAKQFSGLSAHWSRDHHLDLRDIPAPTPESPKSYAKCVRMQSLFPCLEEKWFTVVQPQKLPRLNQFVVSLNTHHSTQKQKVQHLFAAKHREHNMRHSYLHRMPAEIRYQIYDLALASDVTYHIEDMLSPGKLECSCQIGDENSEAYDGPRRPHPILPCVIEAEIERFYQQDRSYKLRAISLSSGCRNPAGLLQACSLANREASPIFYSRNRFFVHNRWADWTSVNQLLDLLRPETRRYIQHLGVLSLRPTANSDPKPDGHHANQAALYYASMRTFLHHFVPQLSLSSLLLCLDLCHLYHAPNHDLAFSPQAPWLNPFLRLPLNTIDIRILHDAFYGYVDNHDAMHMPGSQLVDRINALDFRTRIRAKWLLENDEHIGIPLWWKDVPAEERLKRRDAMDRYSNEKEGYSFLDIWAQCATDAFDDIIAKVRNPYQ